MLFKKAFATALTALLVLGSIGFAPESQARNCWQDRNGRVHCDNGRDYYYNRSRRGWVDTRTGSILKGGLWGAGIGAGAGYLTGRGVGRSAVLGAGIGAGVQATRTSPLMYRHPILKTATYGALAGAGAGHLMRDDGDPVKGALWGAAIGTGVGAFRHMGDY